VIAILGSRAARLAGDPWLREAIQARLIRPGRWHACRGRCRPLGQASDPAPMFVPLQQLEDLAPGTWYVNVLATYPRYRGRYYGAEPLSIADDIARDSVKRGLSIIVADANAGARRLYERCGYRERARRAMVKGQWQHPGTDWVLLVK